MSEPTIEHRICEALAEWWDLDHRIAHSTVHQEQQMLEIAANRAWGEVEIALAEYRAAAARPVSSTRSAK